MALYKTCIVQIIESKGNCKNIKNQTMLQNEIKDKPKRQIGFCFLKNEKYSLKSKAVNLYHQLKKLMIDVLTYQ